MISVVIPSRQELYLNNTVQDILAKAKGDTEIIVVLDGYWPSVMPVDDKRVIIIHRGVAHGMRSAINSGVAIAKGKYILKCDAHCMFDYGFDTELANHCENNWIVVPRRKRLDAENWKLQDVNKPDVDYMYLSYPYSLDRNGNQIGLHGVIWDELNKTPELKDKKIDDLMTSQGSCWFMPRYYYYELELLDEINYGAFWSEFQEIGLKCWLSGGQVKVNKNTWYAHLHKKFRGYSLEASSSDAEKYVMKWMNFKEAWAKQTLPIEWLIHEFNPPRWPYEFTSDC
jgi:glycosyltransferase involved in cell wall biosynthesis